MVNRTIRTCTLLLVVLCSTVALAAQESVATETGLTFFGWSDQHIQTDGNGDHLLPAIDAMNALPGTPFPEKIGGIVDKPAFVFGCGDISEWPTTAARDTYDRLVTTRMRFPSYDIAGNHDEGGRQPVDTMKNWIIKRHKSLSYTFEKGGVKFIALFAKYDENLNNPAQPLAKEALDYLREVLDKAPKEQPVIVAAHLCYDAMTNRDELVKTIGDANVLMVLGGHYHKAKADPYHGVNFVQLPSPAPGSPSEFTVIRITADRAVAVPYDYEKKTWSTGPRKVLDVRINGPRVTEVSKENMQPKA